MKISANLLRKAISLIVVFICTLSFISNAQVNNITNPGAGPYATIQLAIDNGATGSGDIIQVGAGTYNENVLVNKSVTIQSVSGRAATIVNGTAGPLGTFQIAADNVIIGGFGKGFTINGYDSPNPGLEYAAVYIQGVRSNITLRGNDIVANGEAGLLTEFGNAVNNLTLNANIFSGKTFVGAEAGDCGFANQFTAANVPRQMVNIATGSGITFTSNLINGVTGSSSSVAGCTVFGQGNTIVTIDASNVVIRGNTFAGTTTRFGSSLRARGTNVSINCNTFDNAGLGLACVHIVFNSTLTALTGGASPSTIAGVASANTFISEGAYFTGATSIYRSSAQVAAIPQVPIAANSVIMANVTNTNTGETFCSIQSAINDANTLNGHTIQVGAGTYNENIVVNKSLTIRGPNNLISPNGGTRVAESTITGGLSVDNSASRTIVIEGFRFQGVTSPMVYNGNLAGTIAADLTFRKNLVDNSSGQLAVDLGTATNSAMVVVDDNSFASMSGNAIQLNGGTGILNATVTNNSITGTGTAGINTNGISTSTFDGNTISNTGQQGIQVAGTASNVTISNNVITNANTSNAADRGGIRLRGGALTGFVNITNNIISGSNNGIALPAPDDITGKSINVNNNNLSGNTKSINHFGTGTLNATCNWYGTANHGVIATKISGPVTYIPYLTNGADNSAATGFQPFPGSCNGTPVSNAQLVSTTNVTCFGGNNGSATISFDNGFPAFSYSLNGGPDVSIAGSPFTISNLTANPTYTVVVKDGGGNTATTNFAINQPAALPIVTISSSTNPFCSGVTLTANPAGAYVYHWSNGATTQSITLTNADPDGLYTVFVTVGTCSSAVSAPYNYLKQGLLNSYTIIGLKDVKLGQNNYVTGSVGNTGAGRKVAIDRNSTVSGFIKASVINLTAPVTVSGGSFPGSPAVVTLPTMQLNIAVVPAGNFTVPDYAVGVLDITNNYNNLTIGKNVTVNIKGTIYGNIVIREGAKVTFTQPVIDVNNINTDNGKSSPLSYTTMNFNGSTVRVKNKVVIGDRNRLNGTNTTFYMGDASPDAEKFTVRSNNTMVIANVYMPKGTLAVRGNVGNCTMTGMFISENISSDKLVTWNGYDCNNPPPPNLVAPPTQQAITMMRSENEIQIIVKAYPNPSATDFNIMAFSNSNQPFLVRIIDVLGIVKGSTMVASKAVNVKSLVSSGNSELTYSAEHRIGANLPNGVYFAEVSQGEHKQTVKIIKMN